MNNKNEIINTVIGVKNIGYKQWDKNDSKKYD